MMKYLNGHPYELLQIRKGLVVLCVTLLDLYWASDDMFVYLVHFHEPITRSNGVEVRHYLGSTTNPGLRLWQHEHNQNGSALIKEANRRGIIWSVPIVWKASRDFERKLKREGHFDRHCPLCWSQNTTMQPVTLPDEAPF